MSELTSPDLLPFSIAAGVVVCLAVLEVISGLFGGAFSFFGDHAAGDFDGGDLAGPADGAGIATEGADAHGELADGDGLLSDAFAWLNLGRVPTLVLLILLFAFFAATGFAIQGLALSMIGALPWPVAVGAAGLSAVYGTRAASRVAHRWLPRDETYVVRTTDFEGLTGTVVLGPLKRGATGKIKLQDAKGNAHFPRAEPYDANDEIGEGETVLVIEARGVTVAVSRATAALKRT